MQSDSLGPGLLQSVSLDFQRNSIQNQCSLALASCTLFLLGVLLEFDTKSMHSGPGLLHSISPCISIGIGYKINTLWPWPPALCFSCISLGIQYKINALWPWPPALCFSLEFFWNSIKNQCTLALVSLFLVGLLLEFTGSLFLFGF